MSVSPSAAGGVRRVRVAIDRSAAASIPEVTYVFRTLLRAVGLPWEFVWADTATGDVDVAYGPGAWDRARVRIPQSRWSYLLAGDLDPVASIDFEGVSLLRFSGEAPLPGTPPPSLTFPLDVIFSCYWWLTGAREHSCRRDHRDNLSLGEGAIRTDQLLSKATVSRTATLLRRQLERNGFVPSAPSWRQAGRAASFSLTHDVDYPEIIRWIEVPRLLLTRGARGPRLALDVATGRTHFWTFNEWVEFAKELGTVGAFYFMARQGSLAQYARGVPDAFYDVGSPRFVTLLRDLRERGCEIGLHASYHAYRDPGVLTAERERIERIADVTGIGNRHHYWHLDPDDPNETLRRHEAAGLSYDSSLGFEFYPGFRRGTCQPFRVFHSGERRELDIVQLPPTWMDDHFGRRLVQNGIQDPEATALQLVDEARAAGGSIVLDYHVRGANAQVFPEYGAWLMTFLRRHLGSDIACLSPRDVVASYRAHAEAVERQSVDHLAPSPPVVVAGPIVEIGRLRGSEIQDTAALHQHLFGDPAVNGYSVGTLGVDVLANIFYRLNLDNDAFCCDVARVDGRVVGFSVYATDRTRVFRHLLKAHAGAVLWRSGKALLRRPTLLRAFLGNLAYLGAEDLPFLAGVSGWWIVAGVEARCRTDEFERRVGGPIAARLFDRMEERLRAAGCESWYGVVRPDNVPINRFLVRRGAEPVGTATAQGLQMRYYVKRFLETAAQA